MQDQNNRAPSSEQQTLPTTLPLNNYLYSAANNFPVVPCGLFPLNQWPHTDGLGRPSSSMNVNQTTTSNTAPTSSTVSNNVPVMSVNQTIPVSSNVDMPSNSNNVPPFMSTSDPVTYGMNSYVLPEYGDKTSLLYETIVLPSCVLYPPVTPVPANHSMNPCHSKTLYVGGIPEKATQGIMKEVFARFGLFLIHMRKNFCTLRFYHEFSAKRAFFYNGWEIKIEDKDDPPYVGRLFIDYDKENKFDEAQLEMPEGGRTSPPPFVPCSEKEITNLGESLGEETDFEKSVRVLISWLERGECNKRNANYFYSMIQKTYNHVQKLMNLKAKFEEDLNKAKITLHDKMIGLTTQLKELKMVLKTAQLQKAWDHFTKPQRRNLDLWVKEIEDVQASCLNELLCERNEEEMDMSDEEGSKVNADNETSKSNAVDDDKNDELKEQIDNLQNQLKAAEQEVKEISKDKQETVVELRQEFQVAFQKVTDTNQQVHKIKTLIERTRSNESTQESETQPKRNNFPTQSNELVNDLAVGVAEPVHPSDMSEKEILQVGLIGTFLNVHPFGASIDYLSSYLSTIDPYTNTRDIENVMRRFPTVFQEVSTGIGSTLRKKWQFLGFQL